MFACFAVTVFGNGVFSLDFVFIEKICFLNKAVDFKSLSRCKLRVTLNCSIFLKSV